MMVLEIPEEYGEALEEFLHIRLNAENEPLKEELGRWWVGSLVIFRTSDTGGYELFGTDRQMLNDLYSEFSAILKEIADDSSDNK